jgi:hypothetical protein
MRAGILLSITYDLLLKLRTMSRKSADEWATHSGLPDPSASAPATSAVELGLAAAADTADAPHSLLGAARALGRRARAMATTAVLGRAESAGHGDQGG